MPEQTDYVMKTLSQIEADEERLRELQEAIDKGEQPDYEAAEYVELLRRRNRG